MLERTAKAASHQKKNRTERLSFFPVSVFVAGFALILCLLAGNSLATTVEAGTDFELKWPARRILISLSSSFEETSPAIMRGSDVRRALENALKSWSSAANISFEILETEQTNVSATGSSGDGVNLITIAGSAENILFLATHGPRVPAATRIFYDRRGRITEADIVLNPAELFSTNGAFGSFDLETVFVHEIGHLLGFEHSELPFASMYDGIARNGILGGLMTYGSKLSEADIIIARAKYGPAAEQGDCCGSLSARILLNPKRSAVNEKVWLEEELSGRLVAASQTDRSGNVRFEGLEPGSYRVLTTGILDSEVRNGEFSQPVEVAPAELARETLRVSQRKIPTDLLFGTNGQLSNIAVQITPETPIRVFVQLPSAVDRPDAVTFRSDKIRVLKDSMVVHSDYEDISVISFDVIAEPGTPPGGYSILLERNSELLGFLPGALNVTKAR